MKMRRAVYECINDTFGKQNTECGGILGRAIDAPDDVITEYYFDATGSRGANGYAPDVETINKLLTDDWMQRGVIMAGIVHSHTNGVAALSCGDLAYGARILEALDTVDKFYLPIALFADNGISIKGMVISFDKAHNLICKPDEIELID